MSRLHLEDLYRIAVPSDPRLRPDGGAVAYTLTRPDRDSDENRTEIWLAAPGTPPRRLVKGTDPRWSPDGRTLAFVRAVDGKPQIHLLPMDGGEPWPLTSAPLGAGPAAWSPDGNRIAFTGPVAPGDGEQPQPTAPVVADRLDYKADGVGLVRGLTTHLFVADAATGETTQVTRGDFHAGAPSWSPDGTRLAFVADLAPDRDLVVGGAAYEVGVGSAAGSVAGSAAGSGAGSGAGSVDAVPERLTGPEIICVGVWWLGERMVVAGLSGGPVGHVRLFTLGPGGAAEVKTGLDRNVMLGHPGYPGADPALLGEDLLFCARDRGCTHLYRAPGEKLVPEEVSVSGVSVSGASAAGASTAGRIAYVAATPHSPGDVYLAEGEHVTRLTDHALDGVDLLTPVRRTFTAPDGTLVEGFVLRDETASTGPGPLLLDVHGGPHNAWAPVFDGFHLYHQVLAARGWTVLTVNPRGSDGYGEAFFRAAVGAWGLADAQDFLAAVDALVADGIADPDRLAVTGYSYGGYMACWLTATTDRFRAAIPGGCASDLSSISGTSDMGLMLRTHETPGDLAAQSPITQVAAVTAATLLLHGEDDDRCPVGQAEQWFAALRARRVPVRLVRYPGADHLFILAGRPSHRLDYNERILAWLEQWIDGSPS